MFNKQEPRDWRTRRGARNHWALPVHPWSKRHGCSHSRLDGAQIVRRRLAGLAIGNHVIGDLLALVEGAQASAFDRADVNEDVLAAILRLNETEALLAVEPLNGARAHRNYPLVECV